MKKITIKNLESNVIDVARQIVSETSVDDVSVMGEATKLNNLGVLTNALDAVKNNIASVESSIDGLNTQLVNLQLQLNQLIDADQNQIGDLNRQIHTLSTSIDSKIANELVPLNNLKKDLTSSQKIYLTDNSLVDFVSNETKVGIDFSNLNADKQVLILKEKDPTFTLANGVDIVRLLVDHPSLAPLVSIDFNSITPDSQLIIQLVNEGKLIKTVNNEVKLNSTTRQVGSMNWLADEVEDN